MSELNSQLGEKADKYFELRDEKDRINDELKGVNKELGQVEKDIIDLMEESGGLERFSVPRGTLSLKVQVHPKVVSQEEFVNWCVDNNRWEFLEKSCNAAAYRETLKEGLELPPGTDSYNRETLNMHRAAIDPSDVSVEG